MKARITQKTLTRRPPATGQVEVWDSALPGFGLRISYGGRKTFFCMTRINGKQRRLSVGNAELIGLADARDKARVMMRDAGKGIDPAERERLERREAQKARQDTFSGVATRFMREHGSKLASAGELQRMLDAELLPVIGHLPIAEITRTDIKELALKKQDSAPVAANRLVSLIRSIFNYALDDEILDSIPNLRRLRVEETPRDRVLTDDEIRDVWRACLMIGYPYGHLVRFALLSAQRRGECAGLVRDELNGDGWKLPKERSKNGVGHLVPLSAPAQAILDDCPRVDGTSIVFAGTHRIERDGVAVIEPCRVAGWSDRKLLLDKMIMDIRRDDAKRAGGDPDKVEPMQHWVIHDLRRSAATGLQSLGFTDDVIDRVLNHVQSGVRKAYNHFSRDAEKARALDAWARHVEGIVSGEPAPENVVELADARA